ncbi:MAG: agmatine deiminase family protein [Bacteroidota bacterium]
MKHFVIFLVIITVSCTNKVEKKIDEFTYPPEWELHEAIWTDYNYEPYNGVSNDEARLVLINHLAKYVKTNVIYDNDSLMNLGKQQLIALSANMDSIEFVKLPFWSSWMRDPLMFITDGQENKILDFEWSCYGGAYGGCEDDLRGLLSNNLQDLKGYERDSTGLFFEGGAIEVSNNTILAYKALATQRNPNRTIKEVEEILLNKLGKEQIIWLDEFPLVDKPGIKIDSYFGQGANGHIDVTTRFLNDSTILATVISEEDRYKNSILEYDYGVFQKNLAQLKAARQPNGRPYYIETIDAPDYSLFEFPYQLNEGLYYGLLSESSRKGAKLGDSIIMIPALEYANFTITNGVIIASEYWKEGMPESEKRKDQKLRAILEKYFPNRDIITMDALPINWGGGGVHCRTQQEPKLNSNN